MDKLSSADHVLCANALYLINALMRDSIVNAGNDEWPKFIKRLQELGVINGVEALMRGESLRDLAEPILEFQGLNKVLLSRWKDVRVDVEIPEHRRALRQLHALSFPSDYQRTGSVKSINPRNKSPRPLEDIRDNKWRRLGFRSQSPATEFEETGFLSMMDLIEYVRTNLETYQETLLEQSVLPVEQRCPIARASLSVTAMLYEYFDVDSIKTRDATKGAEHIRDVERMVQPLLLLWARVHAATLNAFMRLWNEARASQKEFHKIEHLVRLLIRKVLDSADRRSSTSQVEDEFGTISLQSIRQLQLAEMDSDFSENWGTDLRYERICCLVYPSTNIPLGNYTNMSTRKRYSSCENNVSAVYSKDHGSLCFPTSRTYQVTHSPQQRPSPRLSVPGVSSRCHPTASFCNTPLFPEN